MARLGVTMVLALALLAMAWRAYGQDFSLEDAFDDDFQPPTQKPKPKPQPPKNPGHGTGDFDLSDFFDDPKPTKAVPKRPTKRPDIFKPTRKPFPKPPQKPSSQDDFNLEDALDDKNDPHGRGSKINGKDTPKGGRDIDISDSDLEDIVDGGYKPDKGKGGGSGGRGSAGGGSNNDNYDNSGNMAETGTIAGIASALVMALVGAVSSYISYQQKKFCFSIQQGLNAEYVKGENMEGVMAEEPQVKYSSLEAQSAAPPTGDPSKV